MTVCFLGTGTSDGIPSLGCRCPVCTHPDPRNTRTRSSVWIRDPGKSLVIDTTQEFRVQCLRERVDRLDAVLVTHAHADHILGLDDTRKFSMLQRRPIPVYGTAEVLALVRRALFYVFESTQEGGGKPSLDLHEITGEFPAGGFPCTAVPVKHGELDIAAYRIGDFAYVTDASAIPETSMEKLRSLDLLVLNTLRYRPHSTHFNVEQSLATIEKLAPSRAYLTHLCHDLEHAALEAKLPPNVRIAYDGLRLEVPSPGA